MTPYVDPPEPTYTDPEAGHRLPNAPTVDISGPLTEIADLLGLDRNYVNQMTIRPHTVEVVAFRGRDGRFRGPKYIDKEVGEPMFHIETHKVKT